MYLRALIASSAYNLARPTHNSRRLIQLAKQFLPYALYLRKDGRFLTLNRQYKPLGFPPSNDRHFDYDSDDYLLLTFAQSEVTARPTDASNLVMLYLAGPWRDIAAANEYKATLRDVLGIRNLSEGGIQYE